MSIDDIRMSASTMQGVKASMPSRPSATEENFQELSNNIEELFDLFHRLGEMIQPILTEGEPSTVEDKKGYRRESPVAERLAVLCGKTEDLKDRVKYLTGRVDL